MLGISGLRLLFLLTLFLNYKIVNAEGLLPLSPAKTQSLGEKESSTVLVNPLLQRGPSLPFSSEGTNMGALSVGRPAETALKPEHLQEAFELRKNDASKRLLTEHNEVP